jgi:hypothetical protein
MDSISNKINTDSEVLKNVYFILKVLMLIALFLVLPMTLYFFKLQDITKYTFSVIGNYFSHEYRPYYLFWSVYTGTVLLIVNLTILIQSEYKRNRAYVFSFGMSFLLIITSFIPARSVELPLLHTLHFTTSILFGVFTYLTYNRFLMFLCNKHKFNYKLMFSWFYSTFIGSFAFLSTFGRNGLFQIWYFFVIISLLIFLSVKVLFPIR